MEDGREDSASHDFLEPEISVASTLSIGADREREARDTLHPRTFEDDTGSSSSEDEACRHDQRADLQKMMSRRNFAVVDGTGGLRHRVKSSSRVEPAAAPESHGSMGSGTGHGRRRSSMVAVPEANEASPGDQPQSYQVRVCERERVRDPRFTKLWGREEIMFQSIADDDHGRDVR